MGEKESQDKQLPQILDKQTGKHSESQFTGDMHEQKLPREPVSNYENLARSIFFTSQILFLQLILYSLSENLNHSTKYVSYCLNCGIYKLISVPKWYDQFI